MALLGSGVLAIWNGMEAGHDEEFLEWHVKQHIPERLGVDGFLRGRRYVAIDDAAPRYFNFYEVRDTAVLQSPAYLARLNAPTDWTRTVVSHFTETSRTLCNVARSAGTGTGSHIEAIRFDVAPRDMTAATGYVDRLAARHGIVAVHLLTRDDDRLPDETAENRLRKAPDGSWAAILLIESCSAHAIEAARAHELADAALAPVGLDAVAARGLYAIEYALSGEEIRPSKDGGS